MSTRFKMEDVQPAAYQAMLGLEKHVNSTAIDKKHLELIKIKASQINRCAYCTNMHYANARKAGETEHRLNLISTWKAAKDTFSQEEQLLLAMTEEITLIHRHGLSDDLYNKAIFLFGQEKTAQIIMAVIAINAWNRIAVSLKKEPEL